MKIGYFGFNNGTLGNRDDMRRILTALDDSGFESAWTGEHVVLIDPQEAPSPVPPEFPMLDTVSALAFAAGVTENLKLGSGIILLAQRNPVVLAKELTGIDVLSNGRLIFGVGVGYVKHEFDTIGVPYEERGERTTEHIEAIRALWTQDKPTFNGRFTTIDGIQQKPMPVQKPHPPIVVGGMSVAGHRRALAHADGWYGFALSLEDTEQALQSIDSERKQIERPATLGDLEISVTPRGPVSIDEAKSFADLGVDRLILMPGAGDVDGILRFIEEMDSSLT